MATTLYGQITTNLALSDFKFTPRSSPFFQPWLATGYYIVLLETDETSPYWPVLFQYLQTAIQQ